MADFETFIRKALVSQNDHDPAVRARVYKSSYTALEKMLSADTATTENQVRIAHRRLRDAIGRIEVDYMPAPPNLPSGGAGATAAPDQTFTEPAFPPPQPAPAPAPIDNTGTVQPPTPRLDNIDAALVAPSPHTHQNPPDIAVAPPHQEPSWADPLEQNQPSYEDQADADEYAYQNPTEFAAERSEPFYSESLRAGNRRNFTRMMAITLAVVLLALLAILAYSAFLASGNNKANGGSQSDAGNERSFITLLSADEASALVTEGRGTAEIVTGAEDNAIRIMSTRSANRIGQPADPILLRLQPGVLDQVEGKEVTVEMRAKSGTATPNAFSVRCQFSMPEECGRKRFRVGIQPEAIVFSIAMPEGIGRTDPAFLAINTDLTSQSDITGRGAALDIYYVRMSTRDNGG